MGEEIWGSRDKSTEDVETPECTRENCTHKTHRNQEAYSEGNRLRKGNAKEGGRKVEMIGGILNF